MQSTSRNNFNSETIMPSIKPEIIDFFQSEINPDLNRADIATALESMRKRPNPNPIIGTPVNLLYLQDGNNLAAVVVREDNTGKLYTFSADCNLVKNPDTIAIENLKDFQFRFQDALNHDSLVSVNYQNNMIESLVIIKQERNNQPISDNVAATMRIGKASKCLLPPNFC